MAAQNGLVDILSMFLDKATENGHLEICKMISDIFKKPRLMALFFTLPSKLYPASTAVWNGRSSGFLKISEKT